MKKSSNFSPDSLRIILIIILIVLIGAAGYGFYWAENQLNDFAIELQTSLLKSKPTEKTQTTNIKESQATIDKATKFQVSTSTYLSQATSDINTYAIKSGITIESILPENQITPEPSIGGLEKKLVNVQIKNPAKTIDLITFLKLIETNIPKMQIQGITLNNSSEKDSVNVEPIIIELYTE